jgi:hypothetical protein
LNYSKPILKTKIQEINKFVRRAKEHLWKIPKQALGLKGLMEDMRRDLNSENSHYYYPK